MNGLLKTLIKPDWDDNPKRSEVIQAANLIQIGEFQLQMPMDWSILTTDESFGSLEVIPLASLNNRGFVTPVYNPMRNGIPDTEEIQITNVYQDVKWYFPRLKNGHILVIPLEDKKEPKCAMFVKEANKIPQEIDIGNLLD